jgi:hypothetical protein
MADVGCERKGRTTGAGIKTISQLTRPENFDCHEII